MNLDRFGLELNRNIVDYLKADDSTIKITDNSIAVLKYRQIIVKIVPRTKIGEEFIN
jgi:hypothetical protein